eukprot:TRINITY_DN429_c0_g2_i1.p2 TRINITY_DN429_c0_g2~~TRINITY_DN429_c0_g2_i1.p2  ORF type:complete len:166 (-),score=19.82 TRINITY_DN429_c0_g2_i1:338-763(-)
MSFVVVPLEETNSNERFPKAEAERHDDNQATGKNETKAKELLKLLMVWRQLGRIVRRPVTSSECDNNTELDKRELGRNANQELKHFRGDSAESVPTSWTGACKVEQQQRSFVQASIKTVLSLGRWRRPANNKDVEMMKVQS